MSGLIEDLMESGLSKDIRMAATMLNLIAESAEMAELAAAVCDDPLQVHTKPLLALKDFLNGESVKSP